MMRILLAMIAMTLLGGCSAGPLRRASAPPGEAVRSAAARSTLLRALSTGDWAVAETLIAPHARLRLPDASIVEGRAAVLAGLRAALPIAHAGEASFDLARTVSCTGALQDLGMLLVRSDAGAMAGLHATLLWRATGLQGGLQLHAAALHPSSDYALYRARPCAPPGDSAFHARRYTAVLVPGPGVFGSDRHGEIISEELQRTGWEPPLTERYDPFYGEIRLTPTDSAHDIGRPVLASGVLRRELAAGLFAAVRGGAVTGATERTDSQQRWRARLEYLALHGAAQAGFSHGWLHAAAGPAFMFVSGSWRTEAAFGEASPFAEKAWTASTLGLAVDGGLLLPLSRRAGIDLSGYHRSYPDVAIPGYAEAGELKASFTEWGVSAGLAVKF